MLGDCLTQGGLHVPAAHVHEQGVQSHKGTDGLAPKTVRAIVKLYTLLVDMRCLNMQSDLREAAAQLVWLGPAGCE